MKNEGCAYKDRELRVLSLPYHYPQILRVQAPPEFEEIECYSCFLDKENRKVMMEWVSQEFETLSFGDKRLKERAKKLVNQLSCNSTDSIPSACRSASDIKAAYRFFDNDRVSSQEIHASHRKATLARMSEHPVILIPQDTTVLNFSTQHDRKDAGPTTKDTTKGIYLHCALAITPERLCLGMLSSREWHRERLQKLTKKEQKKKNYSTAIEEKESYRWLENYKLAKSYACQLPDTLIVSMADREGDIYDIYEEAKHALSDSVGQAHYLIRAKTDRSLCDENGKKDHAKIKATLLSETPLGHLGIRVSETQKRAAREAYMTIYAKSVLIALPYKRKKGKNYEPIKVTGILCTETQPPAGSEKIEWLLITSLPVTSFESACEKIQWYTSRWQIEIFFKVLKSGCMIEKLQLTDKNFSVCLMIYLIIAWRILYVVMMGRSSPKLSCEAVFSREEWETAYIVLNRKKPPKLAPSLNEMVRMVASLGGYLNRKKDPEPGVKTMWIGMRNMQEHLRARNALEAIYGNICG